jgi:hypothetical protein
MTIKLNPSYFPLIGWCVYDQDDLLIGYGYISSYEAAEMGEELLEAEYHY